MCGIAGILYRVALRDSAHETAEHAGQHNAAAGIPASWLRALHAGIAHRGPDGTGQFVTQWHDQEYAWHVALLHTRLSIIDASTGQQPMLSHDASGNVSRAIVFNGCIDNHRALRSTLLARGYTFTTHHSDTESLLHSAAEWGEGVCEHLEGMHACAYFDGSQHDVFLSQDEALEKPLWFGRLTSQARLSQPDVLAFASVPASLARLQALVQGKVQAAQPSDLLQWLWLGASDRPVLSGAAPLKARGVIVSARALLLEGHTAVATARNKRLQALQLDEAHATRGDEDLTVSQARAAIEQAVAQRLESDVAVGCFLSGGVDSSLVSAIAKQLTPQLQTFTVRMPDARYDESHYARAVATHIGSQHHELACDASPTDTLMDLVHSLGAPLADSSLLPAHWVAAAARKHVKVALSGDGGDELFAGYERHIAAQHLARAAGFFAALPAPDVASLGPKSLRSKLARLIHAARTDYDDARAIFSRAQLDRLVPGARAFLPPSALHWASLDACKHDFEHALPDDLLLKADHAAMRVALESRAPLLARGVRTLALRAPLASLCSPTGRASFFRELVPQRKALLRAVAKQFVPAWAIDRPKMGFAIPIGGWLRTDSDLRDLLHETIQNPDSLPEHFLGFSFDRRELQRIAREHEAGNEHHDQRLYALIVLSVWCRWAGNLQGASQ